MLAIALRFAFEEKPALLSLVVCSLYSYFIDVMIGRSLKMREP